jgi:hypothetical protein
VNKDIEQQTDILAGLAQLRSSLEEPLGEVSHVQIKTALEQFMECVRYLNTRRSSNASSLGNRPSE